MIGGAKMELFGGLVVFVDRPTVGAAQLDGVGDDARQHGLQIQSRADRLTDFARALSSPTERVNSWFAPPIL